ncbi:hypothetical protein EIN_404950 [Entamoeba invadens IP1]|uniref:EGF-like domain-containing protein n=1 Tax=Entamoeba invadens IP1 TaxID=370355 RepID=A0A0A1UA89_ENTIV|nr:hypothetical protein EIN_404950 [Entamoeba invadens IP1]ELP90081.1 hypothetical protein EIN_404950 [Entamoeba invadens IP1]|eukprot:XP_004256852.1 hypothetical protein EIN_404950 [Entamoeba invadens IP1]
MVMSTIIVSLFVYHTFAVCPNITSETALSEYCQIDTLSLDSQTLTLNQGAILEVSGDVTLERNAILIMQSNSSSIIEGILSTIRKGSIFISDTSSLSIGSISVDKGESILTLSDNSIIVINKQTQDIRSIQIKMNNNSVFEVGCDVTFDTYALLELNENSSVNFQKSSTLFGSLLLTDNSRGSFNQLVCDFKGSVSITGNSTIIVSNILDITSYCSSILFENEIRGIHSIVNQMKIYSKLKVNEKSSIMVDEIDIDNSISLDVSQNRTIRDLPLFFFEKEFSLPANMTITNESSFDFAITKIPLTQSEMPDGFTLLAKGHLIRYNNPSDIIYCHVNITKLDNYVEHYCPCFGCFITPLEMVSGIVINHTSTVVKNEIRRNTEEPDVVYIGDQTISLFHDTMSTFTISIVSNKVEMVDVQLLSKTVFFEAGNGFSFGEIHCYYGYFKENFFHCRNAMDCDGIIDKNMRCDNCTADNCDKCTKVGGVEQCTKCRDSFVLFENSCKSFFHCLAHTRGFCVKCEEGYTQSGSDCIKITKDDVCQVKSNDGKCLLCDTTDNLINNNGVCYQPTEEMIEVQQNNVIYCKKGFYSNGTFCLDCKEHDPDCLLCENGEPTKCENGYIFGTDRKCHLQSCDVEGNKMEDTNGLCVQNIDQCINVVNNKCVECAKGYIITDDNTCVNESKECELFGVGGCNRCIFGTYLDFNTLKCNKCDSLCANCYNNDTFCTSCYGGYFLSGGTCKSGGELANKCNILTLSGTGCVSCKEGYYRVGLDCFNCQPKCGTCLNDHSCLTCGQEYFNTNEGDCLLQSGLVGCATNVTTFGCSMCSDGYYTVNENQCAKCNNSCTKCINEAKCLSCEEGLVLVNFNCVAYNTIENCVKSKNSKCSKCTFWKSPNTDGTLCVKKVVWWVIFIVILLVLMLMVGTIVLVWFLVKRYIKAEGKTVKHTLFNIHDSNIAFVDLGDNVVVSHTILQFGNEDEYINVMKRSGKYFVSAIPVVMQ